MYSFLFVIRISGFGFEATVLDLPQFAWYEGIVKKDVTSKVTGQFTTALAHTWMQTMHNNHNHTHTYTHTHTHTHTHTKPAIKIP